MPSNYTINVSLHGKFYFRVIDEFISSADVHQMVNDFRSRFPESEGFKVSLTRWECVGKNL